MVDQELVRINKGIKTGSVKESTALKSALENVRVNGSVLISWGSSDAGVHSMLDHLYGLLHIAKEQGIEKVYLHAFTDGRDTRALSGKTFLAELKRRWLRSVLGRSLQSPGATWAMDRDNRWDRVERAYNCLTGSKIERRAASAADDSATI